MAELTDKKLVVVVGPTAVGKTSVAVELAKRLGTEIISADSRQLFKEMNIGTAKPTPEELAAVRHHFIDSHSIHEPYDAARFGKDALELIEDLFRNHEYVILVGGSGLYVKAVCEGFDDIPDVPDKIREELTGNYNLYGLEWLQQKLEELDPVHYQVVDRYNPQRMIRALEVKLGTGRSIAEFHKKEKETKPFGIVKVGLELDRKELYRRIDERMDKMIAEGLFDEAADLYPLRHLNALQTVGYQEIFDFIDQKYDKEEAIRLLKRNSRRYAKRQLTWFKRDASIRWFHPGSVEEVFTFITT